MSDNYLKSWELKFELECAVEKSCEQDLRKFIRKNTYAIYDDIFDIYGNIIRTEMTKVISP